MNKKETKDRKEEEEEKAAQEIFSNIKLFSA
jgi:hypothetical protein